MKHQHGEDSTGEPHSQPILLPGNTATSDQSAPVVGVHPVGSGSQFCDDSKSRGKLEAGCCQPCLAVCGRSGSRGIQVQGYQLGVSGRCTPLLAPPVVFGRGEHLILATEVWLHTQNLVRAYTCTRAGLFCTTASPVLQGGPAK